MCLRKKSSHLCVMSLLGVPVGRFLPIASSPTCSLSRPSPSSTPLAGTRSLPCASALWGGMSGHLATPTPDTVSSALEGLLHVVRRHAFFIYKHAADVCLPWHCASTDKCPLGDGCCRPSCAHCATSLAMEGTWETTVLLAQPLSEEQVLYLATTSAHAGRTLSSLHGEPCQTVQQPWMKFSMVHFDARGAHTSAQQTRAGTWW